MTRNLTPDETARLDMLKARLKSHERVVVALVGAGWVALIVAFFAAFTTDYMPWTILVILFVAVVVWSLVIPRVLRNASIDAAHSEVRRIEAVTKWDPMARQD